MGFGGGFASAGQDEAFERRQRSLNAVDLFLQGAHSTDADTIAAPVFRSQISPAGEEIALHFTDEVAGQAHAFGLGGQQADVGVQLVHCAVALKALAAFTHAFAAHEGGLAPVTRFGVDVHSVLLLFVRKGTTFF